MNTKVLAHLKATVTLLRIELHDRLGKKIKEYT